MLGWFTALTLIKKVALVSGAVIAVATVSGWGTPTSTTEPNKPPGNEDKLSDSTPPKVNPLVVKDEAVQETISFDSVTQNDSTLEKGKTILAVAGVNGIKTITYKVTYENGNEISREKTSEAITKEPVTQVTRIGTKVNPPPPRCDPNYAGGCVPVVSYDLDCPDIGFMVRVVGSDKHRFDRDGDGYGCESYQ